MIVRTSLTGAFPRTEALVRATRDLDRGRATPDAVEELFSAAETEVVELEERLGMDAITGGYLRWADLFRPFAETWRGFTVGPVTRWYETNTFYRQPILNAPPERVAGAIAPRLPPAARARGPARAKVILPGPYTFATHLENRSGETTESLTHRLGRLLAEEVRELRGAGYETFQFQEPELVVRTPKGPTAEAVVAAYRAVGEAVDGATSMLWTYFGDAAPSLPLLARLNVGGIGVDLAETDGDRLAGLPPHRAVGLGCIDPRTSLVEDAAEVARIARRVNEAARPSAIWLGPGGPLDLLPAESAARKLHLLPAARQALTAGNGGGR